jgi:hypothetical protein
MVADDGGVNVCQFGRAFVREVSGVLGRLVLISRDDGPAAEVPGLLKPVSGCVRSARFECGAAFIPERIPCVFAAEVVRGAVKNRCEFGGALLNVEGFAARSVGL